jgi:transcriptional regulator with XRE-family HTH domain
MSYKCIQIKLPYGNNIYFSYVNNCFTFVQSIIEMEKRLLLFLKSEDLNPTKFADRIGVQRSSISHILSGRNKPSFDFLIKIFEKFPQLNAEWLIMGKGKMYKQEPMNKLTLFDQILPGNNMETLNESTEFQINTEINENENISDNSENIIKNEQDDCYGYKSKQAIESRKIEKIVILYTDKTFGDYKPL